MTRPYLASSDRPLPEWLAREQSAAPADLPYLERARRLIERDCELTGASFSRLGEPWLSSTILRLSKELRQIDKVLRRTAPDQDGAAFLSVQQAALRLGVSEYAIKQRCRTREIPAVKVGKLWRIAPHDLDAYLARQAA